MGDRLNQTKFGVRNAINSISWAHKFVNKSKVLCSMQRLAYDMIGGTTEHTIGWKAIRFSRESLEFMPILFPCAKYIVNWRKNITAQMQSGWYATTNQELYLPERTDELKTWSRRHKGNAFELPLHKFSIDKFNEMASWLGYRCKYNGVTHHNNHGYSRGDDIS